MILPPPRSTRTDTLVPSPTLFRSRWVGGVSRRPVLVVLLCLAVSVGLAWLAAVTLTINTSTDDMLSKELPFRAQNEAVDAAFRSEEHTSELQSLMRISYAVFCLKKTTAQLARQLTIEQNIKH